jgi:hypothetical protein
MDREWGNFEPLWTLELKHWHKTTQTAAQTGYASNVNKTATNDEYNKAEQVYFDSLQQFSEANQNNTATFNTQTATNAQMATKIVAAVQTLQQQMEKLTLALNAKANAALPDLGHNNHFIPHQQYIPVPPQQQIQQQMYQPPPNYYL